MICDWFLAKMPWLVEHVGGASLTGQIFFAVLVLALIVTSYCGCYALIMEALGRWNNFKRTNRVMRILFSLDDDEYLDWMDRAKWEAEQRERTSWSR